jgi:hypothetical protein
LGPPVEVIQEIGLTVFLNAPADQNECDLAAPPDALQHVLGDAEPGGGLGLAVEFRQGGDVSHGC